MTTALEPALSVRQVLALDRVLAGEPEVVAGAGHLDRFVRWVHVAEAADVGVMLSGGEMVLTTGVLLAGDPDAQAEYIRSLHRAEAAAVVLGLGRAFPAPPDVMRRAAERCGLPMVVLHRPFPFAELTEEVQSRLVRSKFAAVSLSEAVRTALTGLITTGAPSSACSTRSPCTPDAPSSSPTSPTGSWPPQVNAPPSTTCCATGTGSPGRRAAARATDGSAPNWADGGEMGPHRAVRPPR